ncbi:ArsR/SmtB family transcription factor [Methanocella conradii]|uniref:ArsR/SmtB family transcription factor n=1 Tax=Methanocella conradii TaxID=1175444 RepID=UPI00157D38A7|nr:metalloregulator ArsR/SmtB family transcription factor [Methanocella conradii]
MVDDKKCCECQKIVIKDMPSDEEAKNIANFFKAMSDPARVKMIYALAGGELCVCELMEIMGMQQTVVSHHLKVLKYAGIVSDRKSGKWVNYSLADMRALDVLKALGLIRS